MWIAYKQRTVNWAQRNVYMEEKYMTDVAKIWGVIRSLFCSHSRKWHQEYQEHFLFKVVPKDWTIGQNPPQIR